MHLAWGNALIAATSLARVAKPREALVDGDVQALRSGQFALVGARAALDGGQRVRGWKLDLEQPWKRAGAEGVAEVDAAVTQESPQAPFAGDEASTSEVLQIVEASAAAAAAATRSGHADGAGDATAHELAERVRSLALGARDTDAADALAELRRARARAEGGPATARCQASLALAMTLSIAGRADEALLEALDALARARESDDARAVGACMALLAKLYSSAGYANAATRLREAATS
jgi:hypothetical protein